MTSIGGPKCGIVAATFLFVFNTFFALGWLSIPWLYPAELVPLEIRAQANALSTSANWIFNFMVVMITPVAFSSIGWRTYIIFAVFNAASIPILYWCYPETAYRSLEEMDIIFAKATGVVDAVRVARTEPRHFGKHGEVLREMVPDVKDTTGIGSEKGGVEHVQ
ncbi:Sugar transporter STL1 [Rasamsonia emersonii CBS 393.64]|uniref:Sugar transporter STL1 n=1 Tax=Rasamsonia emersonii (strain ATCC 16479 / CBS 393.64 / IMI 116815) TaxID=1408163 RepID=A0A0F4YY16_RASE3|nr:Sugar transporter STL1 [Rasamsonia emersonii CBS 393.64]KKA22533.1 Sugar transporter STL1 [Rasamsonia emersonii CBS 393.64]